MRLDLVFTSLQRCTLESKAFIGMRATVMDGVVVEREAMVAAGALVSPNKRIPQRQMWAGSPAKYVRDVKTDELTNFADAVERYVSLGEEYRALFADKTEGGSI